MSSELRPGDIFAGHRIDEQVGAGGMGVVYRATHLLLERTVALKLIAPSLARNAAFRSRFEREWRMLAALEHPSVISIYEAGEVEDRPYLSMRWVSGGDLAHRLRGTTGLDPITALDILGQVASALDAAHARGVIHRDVKPANVLLEHDRAWLTDFGAGKDLAARDTRTQTGQWVGTVDYVAPELLDGETATARSDIYSLGCVLYETLTGNVPYPRDNVAATLWAHRSEKPPEGLGKIDAVLARALAKQPKDRPASAGELIRAARAALAPTMIGKATVVTDEVAPAPSRTRWPVLAAGAAALVAIGVLAGFLLHGSSAPVRDAAAPSATPLPPLVKRIVLAKNATVGRLVTDATYCYVTDGPNDRIDRVFTSSQQVAKPIKLKYPPHDIDKDSFSSHLWVALEKGWVADVDTGTGRIKYIHTDIEARYIAVLDKVVVVMSPDNARGRRSRLQTIDIKSDKVATKPFVAGGSPVDLDNDFGQPAELTAFPPAVTTYSPQLKDQQTTKITGGIDGVVAELLITPGFGWVSDFQFGKVDRFDLYTGKLKSKTPVGHQPDGLADDDNVVWVANRGGTIDRLNEKTGKKLGPAIDAQGPLSGDITAGGGVAWAAGTNDVVWVQTRTNGS